MNPRGLSSLLVLTAIFLFATTSAVAASDAVALEGTYWRLSELDGKAVIPGEGQAAPHIALHRDTQRVAGFGGCNRFFGQYSASGANISIQPLGGGRAFCAGVDQLERAFLAALANASAYRLERSRLWLLTDDRAALVFDAVADTNGGRR